MLPPRQVANIYNPLNQTETELLKSFVVREGEFSTIFNDIKGSEMSRPETPYIIQGQRGQGKTTLLLKLYYEIKRDKKLNKFIIPVIFNEEQYHINTLFGLWAHAAEKLQEEDETFFGLYQTIDGLFDSKDAEIQAFTTLEQALEKKKKKLILLIDNIGHLFDKFTRKEQQRLREVLITSPAIRLIGASVAMAEYTYDYSKPFFELFRIISLEGLTQKETVTLLLKLGHHYKEESIEEIIKEEPGRVEALRRLTGGVPRTIVLLFEIFIDHENGNAFQDLEIILDRVTPLYKHRMDDLSAQQQKIVDAIALNWDAVATKEIAQKTRLASKAVSSHLKLLEKNRIIHKIKTNTKNHLYQVTERFFNIWYLMRYGRRKGINRVQWLVHFLETWCDESALSKRAEKHIHALKKGALYTRHAFYLTEALARTHISYQLQHDLIRHTREFLGKKDKSLLKELSKSDKELFKEAEKYFKKKEFEKSLANLEAIQNKNSTIFFSMALIYHLGYKNFAKAERCYLLAAEKGYARGIFNLALLYENEFKDFEKAEKYYLLAAEKGEVVAFNYLALLYENEFKDFEKAEKYYLMAVGKGHVDAMFNLALFYHIKINDFKNAEKYYLLAVEKGHVEAMYNLANLYREELQDFQKAEKYYLMAVEKCNVQAMNNLAGLYYQNFKDTDKAEEYYLMAVEKGQVEAMYNLANLYSEELQDFQKAEKYYLLAVEKGHVEAMNNLANLYSEELQDFQKAEKYYLMAVGKGFTGAMNNLSRMYFELKRNKTRALKLMREAVKKEKYTIHLHNFSVTLLWNDEIEESLNIERELMENEDYIKKSIATGSEYLLLLLAKKQYYAALKMFEESPFDLKERLKPLYYAIMYFLKDDYPNEYKKMGAELKQTVEEIIKVVKQWEKDYA